MMSLNCLSALHDRYKDKCGNEKELRQRRLSPMVQEREKRTAQMWNSRKKADLMSLFDETDGKFKDPPPVLKGVPEGVTQSKPPSLTSCGRKWVFTFAGFGLTLDLEQEVLHKNLAQRERAEMLRRNNKKRDAVFKKFVEGGGGDSDAVGEEEANCNVKKFIAKSEKMKR